ncbi:MAG: type II toxin-antitoxin system RelE/ParE family toxin [Planctomycetaceae bacterium]
MMFRVILQPEAESEISAIYQWLASRSSTGAARWFNRFTLALQALASDPHRYPAAPEAEAVGREVRQFLFKTRRGGMYRALFLVEGADVYIVHVRGPGQALLEADDF